MEAPTIDVQAINKGGFEKIEKLTRLPVPAGIRWFDTDWQND